MADDTLEAVLTDAVRAGLTSDEELEAVARRWESEQRENTAHLRGPSTLAALGPKAASFQPPLTPTGGPTVAENNRRILESAQQQFTEAVSGPGGAYGALLPGVRNVVRGVRRIAGTEGPEDTMTGRVLGGVSDIARGAYEVAEPVAMVGLPAAAVAAPIGTAMTILTGLGLSKIAPTVAEAVSSSPGTQQFVGDAITTLGTAGVGTTANRLRGVTPRQAAVATLRKTAQHATPISTAVGGIGGGVTGGALGGPLGAAGGTILGVAQGFEKGPHLATRLLRQARRLEAQPNSGGRLRTRDVPLGQESVPDLGKIADPTKRRLAPELLEIAARPVKSMSDWQRATELLRQVGVTGVDKVTRYMAHPPTLWGFLGGGGRGKINTK